MIHADRTENNEEGTKYVKIPIKRPEQEEIFQNVKGFIIFRGLCVCVSEQSWAVCVCVFMSDV